jgi:hypothetical protein
MAAPKSYQGIIDLTYKELDKNREIVLQDCNRYVKGLTKSGRNNKVRETKVKEVAKQFNTGRACLDKYITVGLGMAGRPTIILRFFGREVARIFLNDNKDKMFTISNPGKLPLENNSKDKSLRELNNRFKKRFENNGLDINKEYEWDSPEGKAFRRIFINKDAKTNLAITNEHYFESQLLSDLSLNLKKGKSLPFIQPIKYAGCRLQFPTKLKASAAKEDNVEYSRKGGRN